MIRALSKFAKPPKGNVVDVTSGEGPFRELSPFILAAPPAQRFENLWQFSKVYPDQVDAEGNPTAEWFWWRQRGFYDEVAHRYPKGKGVIPLYSIYPQSYDNRHTEHLGYIAARRKIYIPGYARNVIRTASFKALQELYQKTQESGQELILLDYDGYDHLALGMTLEDVMNNPHRKMGHAFVLIMLLKGMIPTL